MKRWLVAGALAIVLLSVIGQASVVDVTWTGEDGTGNPYWNVAGNWDPDAPVTNTPGRVTFSTAGQTVTSVVETDRSVNALYAGHYHTDVGCTHTIDLGSNVLSVTNELRSVAGYRARRNTLNMTNGTLRVGTITAAADIRVYDAGTLTLLPGTRLDPVNIGLIWARANPYAGSLIDLRGVDVIGGELAMRRLELSCQSWYGTQFFIDGDTGITAITVTERLWLARGNVNNNTRQYIGDPADSFAYDGVAGWGRFPSGVDLNFGVNATERASVWIAEDTGGHSRSRGVICVAPGGGGSATLYLSELKIGMRSGTGVRRPRGLLDLSEMDACLLDIVELEVAPGRADAPVTDDERGELHLPPGTGTIGRATLGADDGAGFGRLVLNETTLTVTNALSLCRTGEVTLNVAAAPSGLDIEQGFSDAGGTIHVNFTAPPLVETNWAVRIRGDAVDVLSAMVGQGRLTRTIDGSITGRKAGIVQDETYTYFALVDENLVFDPVAIAQDVTFEIGPDNLVLVAPEDVDDGSFDPDDPDKPPQLRLVYDGGPETNVLEFAAIGEYPVMLVANVLDGEGNVIASAAAAATVTVVATPVGTQSDVEWVGQAGTLLMPDRRDWFWSGNWAGGEPPADPTAGTIIYRTQGQGVMGRLAADRTVSRIDAGQSEFVTAHTIDLNSRTLTVGNRLRLLAGSTSTGWTRTTRLTFTNGTLRIGDTSPADITIGTGCILTLGPTTRLASGNVGTIGLSPGNTVNAILDLRGGEIVGGVLRAQTLNMPVSAWFVSLLYLDAGTALDAVEILGSLNLGVGGHAQSRYGYIGDPDDTFNMNGVMIGRFPAGIHLTVGTSTTTRASMVVANCSSEQITGAGIVVAPGGGGSFTGFLSNLGVGLRSGTGVRRPYGILDVAAMDACLLDIETLEIAPGRGVDAISTDNERGALFLPAGAATVATVRIGAPDGLGWGRLSLSNTAFTVSNTLTLGKTGGMEVDIGSESTGIDMANPDPGALTMHAEATLTLRFREPPPRRPHYGFRWAGDHVAVLEEWRHASDGRLVIDSSGLPGPVEIFLFQGATYVGMPPPAGTLLMLR